MIKINPMGPKLAEFKHINDERFFYQIKWDGVRILVHKEGTKVTLINKHQRDKTLQFPELQILKEIKDDFIIDGEMMVVKGEKNSFSQILKRNLTKDLNKIKMLSNRIPVTYGVFDIIYLNGASLMDHEIEKRLEILNTLVENNYNYTNILHVCKNFDDGVSLYETTNKLELEGIVAKKRGSKYIQGKKSYDWIKYKHKRVIKPYIGGIMVENQRVKSLAVGVMDEQDHFLYIGNVGTGLSEDNKKEILEKSIDIVRQHSIFKNFADKNHIWINPEVRCYIEFMEWTDDYTLRSPVFKSLLED